MNVFTFFIIRVYMQISTHAWICKVHVKLKKGFKRFVRRVSEFYTTNLDAKKLKRIFF